MAKIIEGDPGDYWHPCPGCNTLEEWSRGGATHRLPTKGEYAWQFNGDVAKPTFSPSFRHTSHRGPEKTVRVCHYIITDGKIHYCDDSTHALAGQVIEMPDIDEEEFRWLKNKQMKLRDLEPEFLKSIDDTTHRCLPESAIQDADGIMFLCPVCYLKNGGPVGTHSIICWHPRVPQKISPTGGRWEMLGTGIDDLTLKANSSSVLLTGGCNAHFFIQNGTIALCQ